MKGSSIGWALCGVALCGVASLCACSAKRLTTVCGRVYPDRQDDLCWENEYVGFRAYGPGTDKRGEKMFGYDLFLKRGTSLPVIEGLVARNNDRTTWSAIDSLKRAGNRAKADSLAAYASYHIDHGVGMDCYAVGATLGAGATAMIDSAGNIIYPRCYREVEILENGPRRFCARLVYAPFVYDGDTITEERVLTLDSGTNLNHTAVTFHGLTHRARIATGIVLHDESPVTIDPSRRYMAYVDPTQGSDNGALYLGATFPDAADSIAVHSGADGKRHLLAYATYIPGSAYSYRWGYGWDRGNVPSLDVWIAMLDDR